MPALREIFAAFGVDFDDRELKRGDKATKATTGSLKKLEEQTIDVSKALNGMGGTVAGLVGAAGFASMISSTIETNRELTQWSQRLNISAAEMQAWSHVAARFAVDTEDMADALKELQLKAVDATSGGTAQAEMFKRIGISVDDLKPVLNDATALMDLFTTRLNDNVDAGMQAFTVDELMSDAGTRLLPVFRQGTQRIQEQRKAAEKLGGRDLPAVQKAMHDLARTQADLNLRWQATKNQILVAVTPAMQALGKGLEFVLDKAQKILPPVIKIIENSNILQTALVAAGIAVAAAWGPAAVSFLTAAAPLLALVLIVDDLSVALQGGESALEKFLEVFVGAEQATQIIQDMREALDGVFLAMSKVTEGFRGLFGLQDETEFYEDPVFRRGTQAAFSRGRAIRERLTGTVGRAARAERTEDQPRGIPMEVRRRIARDEREAQTAYETRILGPDPALSPGPQSIQSTIDAPMNVNITVNEATDGDAIGQIIRDEIRDEQDRTLRRLQRAQGGAA